MNIIPSKIHAVIDYIVGVLLIASPWLFHFAENGIETWVPVAVGTATIAYSLFTDYELSVAKVLSMRRHLLVDFFSGVLLSSSPWLFGFSDRIAWPHFIFGVTEILIVLFSNGISGTEKESNRKAVPVQPSGRTDS